MRNPPLAITSAVVFVGLVVASNVLTERYGLVWGAVAAGTFTAGLVLAARDAVRETGGLWAALGCVAAGALVSLWLTVPALALASGVAFAVSELADTVVYEPLRRRGKARALAASNVVGAVADSLLFLWLAGFPLWPALPWQIGVKWAMAVALPLLALGVARAVLRHGLNRAGA